MLHLRLLQSALEPASIEPALRPVLFPSETLADAERWRRNLRFVGWLRATWLAGLPQTRERLPAARAAHAARLAAQEESPPSMAEARALYGLAHPTGAARPSALALATERAANRDQPSAAASSLAPPDECTRALTFGRLLEESGALVDARGAVAVHCEEMGSYELISAELIASLARHVCDRREALVSATSPHSVAQWSADELERELEAAEAAAEADERARVMSGGGGATSGGGAADGDDANHPLSVLRVLEVPSLGPHTHTHNTHTHHMHMRVRACTTRRPRS
jgi:hypothetical protein